VAGVVLAGFAGFVLWESRTLPFGTLREPGAGAVPVLLALTLLVCSLAVFAAGAGAGAAPVGAVRWTEWRHALAILSASLFMALALERLGYRLTILLALFALLALVERKGWIVSVVFAVVFSLGSHFLFNTLLKVPMPQGPFGF
jgi:hypothetical protein